jgi:hypothetical protein
LMAAAGARSGAPVPAQKVSAAEPHVDGLRALYEQAPASLAGNAIGIALIGLAWLAAACLLWLLRMAHYLRYRARPDSDAATLLAWRNGWRALVLAQGAMWPIARCGCSGIWARHSTTSR